VSETIRTRGTVVIDVEMCKGCDLCIDACPPRVLEMTVHEVNSRGYRYVYKYEHPLEIPA
jgi:2-oxoglutarate ferredoxin oxidoreductase subunit delta